MDTGPYDHIHDLTGDLRAGSWPDQVWRDGLSCRQCALRIVLLLVPLTVLRRKTLVNFGLADVEGNALSLLSMRHNQVLTEQMVLGLADLTPGVHVSPETRSFAEAIAYGTQAELRDAFDGAENGVRGPDVQALLADPAAGHLIRRLANNFLLLVTLDDTGPARRIVRFSYDEPLDMAYKSSSYQPRDPERTRPAWAERAAAALGWAPTVIRFPTPAAENTQSYHFEVEAPEGVLVASASMVAGRPGVAAERPSWDHVEGGFPVVGLHVCDVPNGSRSRAQVRLRLDRRGWLTSNLLASALSTGLLWGTTLPAARGEQAQAVATALLTVTAAVIVFLVRPNEHQMASRLVTSLRATATVSILLLVAVAAVLTFAHRPAVETAPGASSASTGRR